MDTSVTHTQPAMFFAVLGALAIKLLDIAEIHKLPKCDRPDLSDWLYWASFCIGPLLGAILCYIYTESNVQLNPLLAANIGISAPLLFKTMAQSKTLTSGTINPGAGA